MEILEWLATSLVADHLKRSATLYMFVNAAHILAIGLIVGAILPLDLRLLGFFKTFPLDVLGPFLSRAAAIGVLTAIVTGFCLFTVRPIEYAGNIAFLCKIGLVALAVLNALLLHIRPAWRAVTSRGKTDAMVRFSAAASFFLWLGAIVAGRWIGFL